MKVLFLSGTNSRNAGGVFTSARRLGSKLNQSDGVSVEFLMHSDEFSAKDRLHYAGLALSDYKLIGPQNFGFSLNLSRIITRTNPDIIHTQSLWLFLSHVTQRYSSRTGTPYVVSPRGMLDSWQLKKSKYRKKLALCLYERRHLAYASCLSALCESEYLSIRRLGLRNPVAIIPNGVDLPAAECDLTDSSNKTRRKLLFLSRIDPKKGLVELLEAWAIANPKSHNWNLIIAGDAKDDSYMRRLHSLVAKLRIQESIEFVGGCYGKEKATKFQEADAFILPSFSEGLPMAVLEAWSFRLPTLITAACNLPQAFEQNASIQILPEPRSIAKGIRELTSLDVDARTKLGANGFRLAESHFSWSLAAARTKQLYEWIKVRGDKPDFVLLD